MTLIYYALGSMAWAGGMFVIVTHRDPLWLMAAILMLVLGVILLRTAKRRKENGPNQISLRSLTLPSSAEKDPCSEKIPGAIFGVALCFSALFLMMVGKNFISIYIDTYYADFVIFILAVIALIIAIIGAVLLGSYVRCLYSYNEGDQGQS